MISRQALLRSARTAAPQRALVGQTRTFAAPASSDRVKPPVALFGLDGTYATALVRPS
jgi:F-type H+-transporting ATPase subunit O